jgi:hypothetical protein
MPQTIGVVGSEGDLGSQLVTRLELANFSVLKADLKLAAPLKLDKFAQQASIVHICAPLSVLEHQGSLPDDIVVILHDSVMSSSKIASDKYLYRRGSVVHMLMNSHKTVVIDQDTPHFDEVKHHFDSLGFNTVAMTIKDHDRLMAESQAPLALLVEAIHQPLREYREKGLLTPSGELLAKTLDTRSVAWTPETIRSILRNPELANLLDDIQSKLDSLRSIK